MNIFKIPLQNVVYVVVVICFFVNCCLVHSFVGFTSSQFFQI